MLALIIATKADVPVDFSNATLIGQFVMVSRDSHILTPCVVVPLSVLSNWKTQISDHCTSGTLSSHVYYDSGRNVIPEPLTKFDVVITTYQVVTQDYNASNGISTKVDQDSKSKKKRKFTGGLFDVKWKVDVNHYCRRVIPDFVSLEIASHIG